MQSGGSVTLDGTRILTARCAENEWQGETARGSYIITGAVAVGGSHFMVLKANGTVWTFGSNNRGQLGNGSTNPSTTPVPVQLPGWDCETPPNTCNTANEHVVAIAAGFDHSLAVTSSGVVYAWGDNAEFELGYPAASFSTSPNQVQCGPPSPCTPLPPLVKYVGVAAGNRHSLALRDDGGVRGWGNNYWGQLGDGTWYLSEPPVWNRSYPVDALGINNVVAIAAGDAHSMALRVFGTTSVPWTWGFNGYSQLGRGGSAITPGEVSSLTSIIDIAAGGDHSMALGVPSLWAWGLNSNGQLGTGTGSQSSPHDVPLAAGSSAIAAGYRHSFALHSDGTLRAFGSNTSLGALGDGGNTDARTPMLVLGPADVVALAAGRNRSAAIYANGAVRVWGGTYGSVPVVIPDFQAAENGWVIYDPDGDGLTTAAEFRLGSDPFNPDTNDDGIGDGAAVASGRSATNLDMDGDGLSNRVEIHQTRTNPFDEDVDNDGSLDGADAFPFDPTRSQMPPPNPADTTPPVITLTEPTNAVPVP